MANNSLLDSMRPYIPKADKRLLGTWKSDKKRTLAEWTWTKQLSASKKARFESLFGKLEIVFTRASMVSKLRYRRWEQSRRYFVLAVDETSVAILKFGELKIKEQKKYWDEGVKIVKEFCSKPEIEHIHFDKKYFWISLGKGKNREFFRRIKNRN